MGEDRGQKPEQPSKPKLPGAKALGSAVVLLVLAGYFLWMTEEMGTAAVSGAAPMFAFLGAAAVGVLAAGLAFALGRRR